MSTDVSFWFCFCKIQCMKIRFSFLMSVSIINAKKTKTQALYEQLKNLIKFFLRFFSYHNLNNLFNNRIKFLKLKNILNSNFSVNPLGILQSKKKSVTKILTYIPVGYQWCNTSGLRTSSPWLPCRTWSDLSSLTFPRKAMYAYFRPITFGDWLV